MNGSKIEKSNLYLLIILSMRAYFRNFACSKLRDLKKYVFRQKIKDPFRNLRSGSIH